MKIRIPRDAPIAGVSRDTLWLIILVRDYVFLVLWRRKRPLLRTFLCFLEPLFIWAQRLFQIHRQVRSSTLIEGSEFSNFFSDTSRNLDYLGHFIFTFSSIRNFKKYNFLPISVESSQMGSLA